MMRGCFVALSFFVFGSVFAQPNSSKIGEPLSRRLTGLLEKDSVNVTVAFEAADAASVFAFRLSKAYESSHLFRGHLAKKEVLQLSAQNTVRFISEAHTPKEELNTGAVDYTLNKINLAHHRYPTLRGDSVFVLVKERAFDSTDIDLKGRVFATGLGASTLTTHASLMATIIAGGGNSSPSSLGVAPGALVGAADFANLFPAADAVYRQQKISVENHSYGTVVENFYGAEAAAHDASTVNNPSLLHVFSAGNSGTATPTSGFYSALAATANLTGNFKQSKNTIAVAALDSAGTPMTAASKGPAYDGRLKPELSAYGEDGSSGAAALVSGTAALLQNAFKKMKDSLPSSDLVKAVLLNSADEAGLPGIDYTTGYGSLNAVKALETVLQNQFFQGSLVQGETKSFVITVPANLSKLKITLAWRDVPALPAAAKALLNNLDLEASSGTATWLPWVLNPSPNASLLLAPAERKQDTLNVLEQITIDNPTAGSYTINVKGTKLTTPTQSFSLAYQFDTASAFSWTYPTSNNPLVAGRTHRLRWQTTQTGTAQIEYATTGNNWRSVSAVADVAAGSFKWTVPDTITTTALRLRFPNGTTVFSDTFVVAPVVSVQTGFDCTDSFLLYWNAAQANAYRVFHLPGNYLQPLQQVSDTALLLRKTQAPSLYYSVAPVVNGRLGLRSQTINYAASGTGCYVKAFFLQSQSSTTAFFTAEIGSLFNVKEVTLERLTNGNFSAVKTIVSPTVVLFSFSDDLPSQGANRYRLRVTLTTGAVLYSDVETVYHLPQNPVVLYPNPAPQQTPVNILVKEVGRYSLQLFDATGKSILTQLLNSSNGTLFTLRLPKGLYLLRINDAQGKPFTQKLVVY